MICSNCGIEHPGRVCVDLIKILREHDCILDITIQNVINNTKNPVDGLVVLCGVILEICGNDNDGWEIVNETLLTLHNLVSDKPPCGIIANNKNIIQPNVSIN